MKFFIVLLVITLALLGCERAVDFDPVETTPKLVVEATIENGEAPVVFLSKSLAFFSKITPDILANSFVHNAEVFISNGTVTHKLKEYEVPVIPGYSLFYYSTDSSDLATAITGAVDASYSLRIVHEGKEYTSGTTIPSIAKRIDSIWWEPAPPQVEGNRVKVMTKVFDHPGYGGYIRYFTKRNEEPFYAGWNSVFDDQIIDGTTYVVQVERGVSRNLGFQDDQSYFFRGDTVTFKLCNIDKATFDFWRTLEFSYSNTGNPFSSPTKVMSNISNGGLGYFGGYACQFKTIIIP